MGQGRLLWLLAQAVCKSAGCVVPSNMVGVRPVAWAPHHGNCLCEGWWLWPLHVGITLLGAFVALGHSFLGCRWMAIAVCCCHGCGAWACVLVDGPARGQIVCEVHIQSMAARLYTECHCALQGLFTAPVRCRHAHVRHMLSCFLLAFLFCALLRATLLARYLSVHKRSSGMAVAAAWIGSYECVSFEHLL